MDKTTDPITRLRALLNEGSYTQEEALECLTEIEFLYKTICAQSEVQSKDYAELLEQAAYYKGKGMALIGDVYEAKNTIENLSHEYAKLKSDFYQSTPHEIDFGTGKLYYRLENGSSAYLVELMLALRDAAMVVPLQTLVKRMQSEHGFKRF